MPQNPRSLRNRSRKVRKIPRHLYELARYRLGVWLGIRDPLYPPHSLHSVGRGSYFSVGDEFFGHFVTLAGLKPGDKVLDVGCGTGRLARPLVKYLTTGSYDGFDIVSHSIKWCQKTYTPRHPNFHFHFTDCYNKMYNPQGKSNARDYRFPFATSSFDFAFLASVFTHMLPDDLENYLSEIARALKPGGKCLITYFLLNSESTALLQAGSSSLNFQYELTGCRTIDANVPEEAVAYQEDAIRALYQKHGLKILESIRHGKWSGRKDGLSYQDIVIASRT